MESPKLRTLPYWTPRFGVLCNHHGSSNPTKKNPEKAAVGERAVGQANTRCLDWLFPHYVVAECRSRGISPVRLRSEGHGFATLRTSAEQVLAPGRSSSARHSLPPPTAGRGSTQLHPEVQSRNRAVLGCAGQP